MGYIKRRYPERLLDQRYLTGLYIHESKWADLTTFWWRNPSGNGCSSERKLIVFAGNVYEFSAMLNLFCCSGRRVWRWDWKLVDDRALRIRFFRHRSEGRLPIMVPRD